LFKKLKDAFIPVEPRDRNPTTGIQDRPFFWMGLQIRLIVGERWKIQQLKPLLDAPVDLAAYFPIAGPPELEPRQTPLQELNAF
jgi:hypothetical protein